jgi:hypothetical protein
MLQFDPSADMMKDENLQCSNKVLAGDWVEFSANLRSINAIL